MTARCAGNRRAVRSCVPHQRAAVMSDIPSRIAPLFLAPDTCFCELDEGAIFLSLAKNRYFAIDARYVALLKRRGFGCSQMPARTEQAQSPCGFHELNELIDAGLITTSSPRPSQPSAAGIATTGSIFDGVAICRPHRLRYVDVIKFIASTSRVSFELGTGQLRRLVHAIRERRTSRAASVLAAGARDRELSVLRTFLAIRPWFYTARDACLLDSLVLSDFLWRHRILSTLVIGVRTKPFGAHAWVQIGTATLNDSPENVQHYLPILAVGGPGGLRC